MAKRKQPLKKPAEVNEVFIFRSVGKGGRQRVHKFWATSFELAKEKAILKFSDVIHFKQKPMDLITARKRAAKASLDAKRSYYVIYDGEDGECSVNTAPLRGAAHKFVNGVEDKNYKPTKQEEDKPKNKTLPAQSARAHKLVDAKTAKESAEEDSNEETNNKTKNKMEKVAVKKSAKKVSGKPVKKVAAKKAVKSSGDWGKKVTMSNKDMSAKIKKGYVYRNSMGVNKTKYIPERPNQELINTDYFESKPE